MPKATQPNHPSRVILPPVPKTLTRRVRDVVLRQEVLVVGCLGVAATLLYVSKHTKDEWWQTFWSNIAVTALGVFLTVALVEAVLDHKDEQKIDGLRTVAFDRLRLALCEMFESLAWLDPDYERGMKFQVPMEMIRVYGYRSDEHFRRNEGWGDYVRDQIIENLNDFIPEHMPKKYEEMGFSDIQNIDPMISSVDSQLNEVLRLFSPALHPRQVELIAEIEFWTYQIQNRGSVYNPRVDLRFYLGQVLPLALELMKSLEPHPEPLNYDNDYRFGDKYGKQISTLS